MTFLYTISPGELETNWSLSGRRASSVIHHLLTLGIVKKRVRVIGYADNRLNLQ